MAYIGNTATTQAFTPAVDYFNGDNSTVAFTLSKPVASVAQVQAVIENVPQNPGSAYTVSGNTITFTSAPPSGTANIYVYYTSPITQVIAPSTNTVGNDQLQNDLTIEFADGSASTPSITNSGDTNTGIFFPAADTIAFAEGGAEAMRVDSSGNVGIGTTSPSTYGKFVTYSSGGYGAINSSGQILSYQLLDVATAGGRLTGGSSQGYLGDIGIEQTTTGAKGGYIRFNTAPSGTNTSTERMRINSSGNVGIGTSSPRSGLEIANASGGELTLRYIGNSGYASIATDSGNQMLFTTAFSERMRIDSSGNLLVGATSFGGGSTRGFQINATSTASNAYAQLIKDNNGTEIFQMRCNGGLANYSANNANLSDGRLKTDIQDAGNYLAKICAIPVRTFKYKNQTDDLLNLGVIAQEVEVVAPELVDVSGFGPTPEDGIPLKAIYQTDLQYALMKCIQELKAELDEAKARIAALEGAQA